MMPYLADLNHLKNLYKSAKLNAGDKKFELTSGLPVFLSDNTDLPQTRFFLQNHLPSNLLYESINQTD